MWAWQRERERERERERGRERERVCHPSKQLEYKMAYLLKNEDILAYLSDQMSS